MSEIRPSLPGLSAQPGRPVISPPGGVPKISPPSPAKPADPDSEPLALADAPTGQGASKIRAFSSAIHAEKQYKRKANVTGTGAVRMKSFHGRLSEEGLAFMDDKLNEWLEQHPEVEVKFVNTTIGTFEGKIRETALVLNVWY